MATCFYCGVEKPTVEQRRAGMTHLCLQRAEPEPGTTYELQRFEPDPFTGDHSVDVIRDGRTIAGIMSTRQDCERLLTVRGFKGPFVWPTLAESIEIRKAARAGKRAAAGPIASKLAASKLASAMPRRGGMKP